MIIIIKKLKKINKKDNKLYIKTMHKYYIFIILAKYEFIKH